MLAAACHAGARLTLFFPPDNVAIIALYLRTRCRRGWTISSARFPRPLPLIMPIALTRAALYDFLAPNALTTRNPPERPRRGLCGLGAFPPARRPVAAAGDGIFRLGYSSFVPIMF